MVGREDHDRAHDGGKFGYAACYLADAKPELDAIFLFDWRNKLLRNVILYHRHLGQFQVVRDVRAYLRVRIVAVGFSIPPFTGIHH